MPIPRPATYPFMAEKPLRKRVMKIVTDSTPVEEPKDPEKDAVFDIYRALAGKDDRLQAAVRDMSQHGVDSPGGGRDQR